MLIALRPGRAVAADQIAALEAGGSAVTVTLKSGTREACLCADGETPWQRYRRLLDTVNAVLASASEAP